MEIKWKAELRHNEPLEDINAHRNFTYSRDDKTHIVHERTHDINSYLRQYYKKHQMVGCYVLNDKIFLFPELNTTLKEVAQKIDKYKNLFTYKTYVIESQKWWNNQPSYLCDEWASYHNGTKQAIYDEDKKRAEYSFSCQQELLSFIRVLQSISTNEDLDEFIQFMVRRNGELKREIYGTNN